MKSRRKVYPTDVSEEEWEFVAPCLTLMKEDAPQRTYALREVFAALRWMAEAACPRRLLPGVFPPWQAVGQQSKRWIKVGAFEAMVHDLRMILRRALRAGRAAQRRDPGRAHPAKQSGERRPRGLRWLQAQKGQQGACGCGHLRPHLLALVVTPANAQERAQVAALAEQVQQATEKKVPLAYVDQGYTGEKPAAEAAVHGIALEVVKLAEATRGFVLLPRRWAVSYLAFCLFLRQTNCQAEDLLDQLRARQQVLTSAT